MSVHTLPSSDQSKPSFRVGSADLSRSISSRTIAQLRWLALVGQLISIAIVYFRAGFQWPLLFAILVLVLSAILNWRLVYQVQKAKRQWLSNREATQFLAFDVLQLGFLLWLTGGLMNPFMVLILAPVTVSASILTKPSTALLSFLAVVAVTLIAVWSPPLPWRSGILRFPPTYLVAVWASIVISILFIAIFVQWVAEQARRLSNALLASQMALEREQRLSALGGLAAAAAHELGTPLSTIAVIAKELALELDEGSPAREDAEVLILETKRCREILQQLQSAPESDPGEPYRLVPITTLIEVAAQPFGREGVQLSVFADPYYDPDSGPIDEQQSPDGAHGDLADNDANEGLNSDIGLELDLDIGLDLDLDLDLESDPASDIDLELNAEAFDQPVLPRTPEIVYGLGNLIQNAIQFANAQVEVFAIWDKDCIRVVIKDDGPGFDPDVLPRLGEAYVSKRRGLPSGSKGTPNHDGKTPAAAAAAGRDDYSGLGLGVFIAQTLLSHSQAKVNFSNRQRRRGAQVEIIWPRHVDADAMYVWPAQISTPNR